MVVNGVRAGEKLCRSLIKFLDPPVRGGGTKGEGKRGAILEAGVLARNDAQTVVIDITVGQNPLAIDDDDQVG